MEFDSICYQNICLSQVLIRLDFLEFIDMDILFGASAVEKTVLNFFPKKGMQQKIRFNMMNVITDANGTRAEQATKEGIRQEFTNGDGNKLILSNRFIILEINKYTKYEDLLDMFAPVLKNLLDRIQLTSMRTGIRYINFFNDDRIKPQKKYFTTSIGALLETKFNNNNCIRSMAMNEYIIEDMHLNFRFGMYNPQYPQIMKKPNYVLDYDCFCDEAITGFDVIMSHINKGHNSIQQMFEGSITDQLRKVME